MGDPFGPLGHFFARLPGRRERLVLGRRQPLAWLAADDVAEGVLEALGPPVRREPFFGPRLLLRLGGALTAAPPRRAGLAEPAGPVEGDREDEEADATVQDPSLGE